MRANASDDIGLKTSDTEAKANVQKIQCARQESLALASVANAFVGAGKQTHALWTAIFLFHAMVICELLKQHFYELLERGFNAACGRRLHLPRGCAYSTTE